MTASPPHQSLAPALIEDMRMLRKLGDKTQARCDARHAISQK